MLKKLMKYDFMYIYKVMVIYYILVILFSVLTRIFFIFDVFFFKIMAQIFSGITISMMFSTFITNIMRVWGRFIINMYGDESYLTHTLPMKREKVFLSKFLVGLITFLSSILVICIALLIAYCTKENIEFLKVMLSQIVNVDKIFSLLFTLILAVAVQSLLMQNVGIFSIIIGFKSENKKLLKSILFGFAIYVLTQITLLLVIVLYGIFDTRIMQIFIQENFQDISIFYILAALQVITYTVLNVVSYYVSKNYLKKGVDID